MRAATHVGVFLVVIQRNGLTIIGDIVANNFLLVGFFPPGENSHGIFAADPLFHDRIVFFDQRFDALL